MQYVWTDDVQRFTGSLNANWRPLSWMQNDATVGLDLADQNQFHVCRLNECPASGATARVGNVYTPAGQPSQFFGQAHEHRVVAGTLVGQPEDVGRRGIHERRERPAVRPGPYARARRLDARRDVHVRVVRRDAANGREDARLLCAGAGRAARPPVPHGRGALGSEQRVRYQVPESVVSEGERVVVGERRIVLPAHELAQLVPPSLGVRRERRSAAGDGRSADLHRGNADRHEGRRADGRRCRRTAGQPAGQCQAQAGNVERAGDRLRGGFLQSPAAHRLHALHEEHEGRAHRASDSGIRRRAGLVASAEHRQNAELGKRESRRTWCCSTAARSRGTSRSAASHNDNKWVDLGTGSVEVRHGRGEGGRSGVRGPRDRRRNRHAAAQGRSALHAVVSPLQRSPTRTATASFR